MQEDIKEEDEEEEEDEKKDDVFEPDKKLIGQGKKAEPSTPPGKECQRILFFSFLVFKKRILLEVLLLKIRRSILGSVCHIK